MEIIGAGFGRTGTLSLRDALNELGFKCYHMRELFKNRHHVPLWMKLYEARRAEDLEFIENFDWDTIFKGYRATVDWPGCDFYDTLALKIHPNSKVILTVRDPEKWVDSLNATIFAGRNWFFSMSLLKASVARIMFSVLGLFGPVMFTAYLRDKRFPPIDLNEPEGRRDAIKEWNRHVAEVKAKIPEDRLLIFDVREGWGPLCKFLNVPVPDKPFPNVNDTASMQRRFRLLVVSVFGGLFLLFFFFVKLVLFLV